MAKAPVSTTWMNIVPRFAFHFYSEANQPLLSLDIIILSIRSYSDLRAILSP